MRSKLEMPLSSPPDPPDAIAPLTARVLTRAGFVHAFSTRNGGVTPLPHGRLDFSLLRDPDRLRTNIARFAARVGFDESRLYQAKQVHGARVLDAIGSPSSKHGEEGDAILATTPGTTAAVRVADCVPVLIANVDSGHVVAVHAGWRGVVAGVVRAATTRLGDGAKVAAIGPSIGSCCFEVGLDVAEAIARAAEDEGVIVERYGAAKAKVDLRRAVRAELRRAGLDDAAIEDVPGCTRCDADRFHSYRRDGDGSGRLIGVISARSAGDA